MVYNDAIAKVRKLLNMTTENGCTEAEAVAAAGLAQKLMTKHNIEALELGKEEEVRDWEDPLDRMPNKLKQHWRGQLATVLCRQNGCSVFWDCQDRPILRIVGRGSDVETTRYLYQFCVRELGRLQKNYRGNGRTWLNNWRVGFVSGVAISLAEARQDARSEYAAETGTALIVVDQSLATIDRRLVEASTFMKKKFKVRSGGKNNARIDDGALAMGQRDGKSINPSGATGKLSNGQRRLK